MYRSHSIAYFKTSHRLIDIPLNALYRSSNKVAATLLLQQQLLFNGTSTQKGQFVATAGKGNRLSRLRMANEIQCIMPHTTR